MLQNSNDINVCNLQTWFVWRLVCLATGVLQKKSMTLTAVGWMADILNRQQWLAVFIISTITLAFIIVLQWSVTSFIPQREYYD